MIRRTAHRLAALATVLLLVACGGPASVSQAEPPGPRVLFFDDFDGPAGSRPSPQWRYDTGGGGWGNDEKQVYTDKPANVSLDGQGHLAISARTAAGGGITSARITTKGSMDFTFGRAEARIMLPAGAGLHPAFWMLGSDIDSAGWPDAGEIDVIETLNDAPDFYTGIHAPQAGTDRGQNVNNSGPAPFPLAGQFHDYWVERTPGRIVTGIDNVTLFTATPADLAPGARWVFDAPFFLLLNVAVGGDWPGPTNATTPNPATMLVDWVRVTAL
ncbi:glycoside hydrolase family 16 protein [Mycolicibacterium sp. 018/SC-01/001]|uniref:glycoside hydrolase family 16 protein n=1 Tax=Mycolicibacterium sp. 018/SC-01/001 TaxID=2592069 RepID=UPI00117C3C6A|nr:glycoside hydrolase family 16 protein [Mycolicibacterium sp. 018/SC-01/001]TRW83172.1 glycoside hydrolase family 16 protein [Mycolicibacterium sp. 018/SC-01/001]